MIQNLKAGAQPKIYLELKGTANKIKAKAHKVLERYHSVLQQQPLYGIY